MKLPENLMEFSFIPKWYDKLIKLENDLIMKEKWSFNIDDVSKNTINPILDNYLVHTYRRLVQEREDLGSIDKNKKIFLTDTKACFNTGLINDDYEYIYMYFEKNTNTERQPWVFKNFYNENNVWLNKNFKPLPKKAEFFSSISDLVFDAFKQININVNHILEHKERLPENVRDLPNFKILIEGALARAKRKIEVNYKIAVPQYFEGKIQFLIPLCLNNTKDVDVVLVVEDMGSYYFGSTCITMDMAYNNARVLVKPESDWLNL